MNNSSILQAIRLILPYIQDETKDCSKRYYLLEASSENIIKFSKEIHEESSISIREALKANNIDSFGEMGIKENYKIKKMYMDGIGNIQFICTDGNGFRLTRINED